ncbi:MAG: tetratricopeptide repeat protein [Asticcacaulis sp.]|nr:tetratricopeptide repeat protein [Asticcacaulis sp.]
MAGKLASLVLATGFISLTACASQSVAPSLTASDPESVVLTHAARALQAGDTAAAIAGFGDAAARNPGDADRQTLLAMAYQRAAAGDPEKLDMAAAGYDLAQRGGQDAYWAAVLAGKAAFNRGRYAEAESYFARAVVARPRDGRALLALSICAYRAGDPALAALAAGRATELPQDPGYSAGALRMAALSHAALGDGDQARAELQTLALVSPDMAVQASGRVEDLIRTAATDPVPDMVSGLAEPVNQVSVDVAIVLSQTTQQDIVGMNLLDGLKLQYGYQAQSSVTHSQGVDISPYTRTITDAITLPQLTYSLNLFNRFGQYYSVVARPMLTAYAGETSDFFVGRTAKVAVGGVNTSSLESIDVGTTVHVTPIEISEGKTKLRIEVSRSYLSGDQVGTFSESLITFRQSVTATVEVAFGKTLILSGLSEAVRDASSSKTPGLGHAPVVGSLFNRRSTTNRRDAVLILVTPAPAQAIDAQTWARPEAVERLISLWSTVVAPGSDMNTVTAKLGQSRLFKRGRANDATLEWPNLPRDEGEILGDLLLP